MSHQAKLQLEMIHLNTLLFWNAGTELNFPCKCLYSKKKRADFTSQDQKVQITQPDLTLQWLFYCYDEESSV